MGVCCHQDMTGPSMSMGLSRSQRCDPYVYLCYFLNDKECNLCMSCTSYITLSNGHAFCPTFILIDSRDRLL